MSRVDTGNEVNTLDVRDVEGEPFGPIMAAVDKLRPGEVLVLINGFEPVPLYDVLERQGYVYTTEHVEDDEWHVRISLE